MTGSALAAIVCVATQTTANSIGVGGIPGILSIQPQYMISFAICMAIAIAVPFVLTVAIGKKKLQNELTVAEIPAEPTGTQNMLKAFASGKAISLEEVNDGVFSAGVLGEGMAIIPESDVLCAPADAEVTVIMEDAGHACGLKLDNGLELLLHIGIDTVKMVGDGFEYLIRAGQYVKAGTPLIRFDRDKIKAAGYPDTIVCVIANQGSAHNLQFHTGVDTVAGVTTIIETK